MVRVRHCLFSFFSPFPFLFLSLPLLFLYSSFSFSFPFFPVLFPSFFLSFFVSFFVPFPFLFLSFSFPFPFAFFFLSLSLSFPFPFPFSFLFLSLSYSFLSLPLLFLFLFPFLAHVNSLIKVWSQRLENETIWKGSGFLQDLMCCCCLLGISITHDENHVLNQRFSRDDIFRCSTMLNWPEPFSEKSGPLWNYCNGNHSWCYVCVPSGNDRQFANWKFTIKLTGKSSKLHAPFCIAMLNPQRAHTWSI